MSFHCNQISKTFISKHGSVIALDGIDFHVNDHEFVCIVGPSGCGKTTLLKIIAGLLPTTSGQIEFSNNHKDLLTRNAMVFQDQSLFPWMNVLENVAFSLEMQNVNRAARRRIAQGFLERFGLGKFGRNYPHELSGGMQQRVAILRAFLSDRDILLMDEPFGHLDSQTRIVMQEELLRIWKDDRKTVVYITHDIEEAILLGDRVLVMSGRPGCVREDIPITLARPRRNIDRDLPSVIELRWKIWKMIEDEVRSELGIAE